jgi:hypothetical protein
MNARTSTKRWLIAWAAGVLLLGTAARGQDALPPPREIPEPKEPAPAPQRVFRLESEAQLLERMKEGARTKDNPLRLEYQFVTPDYAPVPPAEYVVRGWQPLQETVEPMFTAYNRLYFEQINAERYGWDLGPIHPLVSAGVFYFDLLTLPYHMGTQPLRKYEADAGYCLPGDPVPLLLYPPECTWTGIATEAAVVGLIVAVFP